MSSATVVVGSALAAGAATAEAWAGAVSTTFAGAGSAAAAAALGAFAFFSLAGAATSATTLAGAGVEAVEAGAGVEEAGADSFLATRFTAVGLELIVLLPVELFSIIKRTILDSSVFNESKFFFDSNKF
jgi:hypothetical protein